MENLIELKKIAKEMNLTSIDTGAMYRCVALECMNKNVDCSNIEGIKEILKNIEIELKNENGKQIVLLNKKDVSKEIRTPEVDALVAKYAAIKEIRDKITMEAAIEMAESGHLVIGTLHTKSCAETIDRMINFYEVRDQAQIKYLLSSLLKLVVSQRLLPGKDDKMVLIPEVMVVDNVVSGVIRRDKISVSEIEDAIQSGTEKGSVSLITSLSQLFIDDKLTLEQAKGQIEEKNIEVLNRTIMQLRIKKGKSMYMNN